MSASTQQCVRIGRGLCSKYVRKISDVLRSRNIQTSSRNSQLLSQHAKQKLSVGVIGAGRIAATVHLPNILQHRRLDLKWIIEEDPARQEAVRDELMLGSDFPFYKPGDRYKLLDDKSLDGVFVLTPVAFHTEMACDGLQRGKAVFVEKPAGVNYNDIDEAYKTAERNKAPLVTGFMRRFDPAVETTMNAVRQGDIGDIHTVTLVTRDSPKPSYEFLQNCAKSGCNIFTDLCSHDIDLLVWMTKAERPESIYLTSHSHDPIMAKFGEADTVTVVVKYSSGIIATLNAVVESVYGYDIRFEVFGSAGMSQMDNPRLSSSNLELSSGARTPRLSTSFPDRFRIAFERQLQHFINCIDGTESPLVVREECLMSAEIVDKGLQSFRAGSVVKFNNDDTDNELPDQQSLS